MTLKYFSHTLQKKRFYLCSESSF